VTQQMDAGRECWELISVTIHNPWSAATCRRF
jgi:hypothetical protein